METIQAVQEKLRTYTEVRFREPHFTLRLLERGGCTRQEVIDHLLRPENLCHFEIQLTNRKPTYALYFIHGARFLKLPITFNKKYLYVKTYILRWRKPWQKQ